MLYIGADHRGYNLKEILKTHLKESGFDFEDLGAQELIIDDDYPDYAALVASKVSENPLENRGILICGSGVGVDVVANKFKGIRSALGFNPEQVKASRHDDDTNVLALASDFLNEDSAEEIVKIWLETDFGQDDRYIRRLDKIRKIDEARI